MLTNALKELKIQLPEAPKPLASYIPSKIEGNLLFISGQLPLKDGKLLSIGPLQNEKDIERGRIAMEQCFLNSLSAASSLIDIDKIKGVLKLTAFVASEESFTYQHLVANGASDLAYKLFGETGKHTRSAIGVTSLPLNASVELEVIFTI
ncbi:MAG: RidA family protein [Leptonema sp. (in: bacteria)]